MGGIANAFDELAGMFGNNEMTFGTMSHNLHKMRRAAFGKLFSPAAIRRLEPTLKDLVNSMIAKIQERISAGEQVNLVHAYSALTQDVITQYCFANSRNVLEKPSFAPHWYDWMQIHCTFTPV
jgi:cytochrome P450